MANARHFSITAAFFAMAFIGASCVTPITPPSLTVALAQGDTALDKAFNIVASAYLDQAPTMESARKAKLKPIMHDLGVAVQAIDAAEALGRADTMAEQVAQAWVLMARAKSLLGIT